MHYEPASIAANCAPPSALTRRTALLGALGAAMAPALAQTIKPISTGQPAPTTASPAIPTNAAVPTAPGIWPQQLLVPGGVARLSLSPAAQQPVVFMPAPAGMDAHLTNVSGELQVLVVGDALEWTAVIGIALAASTGVASVAVRTDSGYRSVSYAVAPKQYKEQRLTVAPGTVDLSPENNARYERERAHQAIVMATFTRPIPEYFSRDQQMLMQVPVPGPRSSSFGLRRVFNGQSRNPHSGMDIAAPTGTPIVSPLPAKVIDVGDYFFNGNTVWLDHGGGLLSLYCHLSKTDVKVGDSLAAGQRLGEVGATGRVTGAHLHWGVMLNRTMVDPALFLAS